MEENWQPIVWYEGHYEVSDLGRVRSVDRWVTMLSRWGYKCSRFTAGKIIKPKNNKSSGYLEVSLSRNGAVETCMVSSLVLSAFIGLRPEGNIVCHRNDIKHDNALSNLYWGTRAQNFQDAVSNGADLASYRTNERHGATLYSNAMVEAVRSEYNGEFGHQNALARKYGVSPSLVSRWLGLKNRPPSNSDT